MPDPLQEVRQQMHDFWQGRMQKKEEAELKNKRGIPLFNLLLEGIREVYNVEGVIAGGAVRDVVAGHNLHKDVDLFLPMDWLGFCKHSEELGWTRVVALAVPPGYAKKGVISRANATVQHLVTDIIFQEKPFTADDLKTFPIYAQRAMYTLDRGLFVTEECQKDVDLKTFTIEPTITNKDVVKNLRAKVQDWQRRIPYADFKVVEPETQEWWEADKALKEEAPKISSQWDMFIRDYGAKLNDPWADLVRVER